MFFARNYCNRLIGEYMNPKRFGNKTFRGKSTRVPTTAPPVDANYNSFGIGKFYLVQGISREMGSRDMGSDQCNQLNFNTIFVLKGYS